MCFQIHRTSSALAEATLSSYLSTNLSLLRFSFLLPSSTEPFYFPLYLFSHSQRYSLFSSCFSSSHLILWINYSGVALPSGWQALWLKCLLARCKWEADCHFEAGGGLLPTREEAPRPPTWKRKKKKGNGWRKEWEPRSSRTANKPFPLFSYSHTPREPRMGCVCYFSPPTPPPPSCSTN